MKLHQATAQVFVPDGKPVAVALKRITHVGIGAHQDDLEFMAFHGILECFANETKWFGVVTCTNGAGLTVDGQPVLAGNISLAQLPAGLVTNNEPSVTLGSLTLSGYPASITFDGSSLLWADNRGNFFSGSAAGNLATSGSDNTANGNSALGSDTSGYNNAAQGASALYHDTSGFANTANGFNALHSNTSGGYNVAIGDQALGNSTDDNGLVAIGYQALQNDNAYDAGSFSGNGENTAIGCQALQSDTYGVCNTANGYEALSQTEFGGFNTAIGDQALQNFNAGDNNIALGYNAGDNLTSGNNNNRFLR